MNTKTTAEQIRETIEKLFRDAGYTAPEVLIYLQELENDNEKLTQTVQK